MAARNCGFTVHLVSVVANCNNLSVWHIHCRRYNWPQCYLITLAAMEDIIMVQLNIWAALFSQ